MNEKMPSYDEVQEAAGILGDARRLLKALNMMFENPDIEPLMLEERLSEPLRGIASAALEAVDAASELLRPTNRRNK